VVVDDEDTGARSMRRSGSAAAAGDTCPSTIALNATRMMKSRPKQFSESSWLGRLLFRVSAPVLRSSALTSGWEGQVAYPEVREIAPRRWTTLCRRGNRRVREARHPRTNVRRIADYSRPDIAVDINSGDCRRARTRHCLRGRRGESRGRCQQQQSQNREYVQCEV